VLLDTRGPHPEPFRRFRRHLAEARPGQRSRLRLAAQALRLATVTEAHYVIWSYTAGIVRREGRSQMRAFRALMMSAISHYRPRTYSGTTVLLRAMDQPVGNAVSRLHDLGWAPYLTGFRIIDVPGNHMDMVEGAELRTTVAALETVLAEVDAELSRP
jgi:thioesterase domain-containing protein